MKVEIFEDSPEQWDKYVLSNDNASLYHLYEWGTLFKDIYKFKTLNLVVYDGDVIIGITTLIIMRNHLMKKIMVSLPYFCVGGILVDNSYVEQLILKKIKELTISYKCNYTLLKNTIITTINELDCDYIDKQKSTFVLPLDADSNKVFNGFEKQIRRRIRKGYKSGCKIEISKNYFNDFYDIYRTNMRLLGSPVHKKSFYLEVLNRFPDNYTILVVLFNNKVIGAQLLSYFKNTVYLPLASSLKEYNEYSPNHLLYWESIKFGCENGYELCDFGRSTIGSGPYTFKQQWNAREYHLSYCYFYSKDHMNKESNNSYEKLDVSKQIMETNASAINKYFRTFSIQMVSLVSLCWLHFHMLTRKIEFNNHRFLY